MKRLILSMMLLATASFFVACGGGSQQATEEPESSEQVATETTTPDLTAGAAIYKEKCIVCHMETGLGVPGAFPPLAESDYLLADPLRAVRQVLLGSDEEMVVNGVTYTTPMPAQVSTHQEAVDVINYVLNTWGNDGGFVTLEEAMSIPLPE